ncbi:MAG: hypothetical protein QOK37_1204 [Thermoanaerobaculia bacterium]|jgi:restriction endonuclease S subunit/predicted ATPase|nr:hypothetical protein [Thermoanaerobaculia bacterium]
MTDNMPNGWLEVQLEEICLPVSSAQPELSPDTEFTYFDIGGIDNVRNRISEPKVLTGRDAPSRARQAVQRDDILFSNVRTNLRNIARIDRDYLNPVASTGFTVIRPASGVSSEFLFYQLLSEHFLEPLHALQTGTSYPAVRSRDVLTQSILLPPEPEQRRIVEKLNAAFSAVERAETASLRARDRLRKYRHAVLGAALTGELTREWRVQHEEVVGVPGGDELLRGLLADRRIRWEKNEVARLATRRSAMADNWRARYNEPKAVPQASRPNQPAGWASATLDQISWSSGYGTSVKCAYDAGGPAVLRIPNILNGTIDLERLKFATKPEAIGVNDYLEPGDLLLVRTNGSRDLIGRAAIVKAIPPVACSFASYLIRFRLLGDDTLWSWVGLMWESAMMRAVIESRAKTTAGQYNLALSSLNDLVIPLPPVAEQHEIIQQVERRLSAASRLASTLDEQLDRARAMRELLLRDAFAGKLIPQSDSDEPATQLLQRIQSHRRVATKQDSPRRKSAPWPKQELEGVMKRSPLTPDDLAAGFSRIGSVPDARRLFTEMGCEPEGVTAFYETLRATPAVRNAFEAAVAQLSKPLAEATQQMPPMPTVAKGRFRLAELWLEEFKNLKDYTVNFDVSYGIDVMLGWNGTGKSNLFESLVIIFRDLHEWVERNRWPDQPMAGYRLSYEIDDQLVRVTWVPAAMKRPSITCAQRLTGNGSFIEPEPITRTQLPLPSFVFGYYSGPTNRLAEHFLPMKQAHYVRLREAKADDAQTLAALLHQRRFFCAETHHAKYVLLAFLYKEDSKINAFLRDRLRIIGFESALFVIRKPRWAKAGSKPDDFWGATGIMRRVVERLRRYAIAPMVLQQIVSDGYRTTTEDHYYFFLPNLASLHSFAAEYQDARTFFLALESTDFSELIHDVKIQVAVKATNTEQVSITFHQMSEGEQQLLMVLGLMRFTKAHQSLVLLDEPDTHLNPHWSIDYLKDLTHVMSDDLDEAPEQQTSQIFMATHDPLVIASLVKEQIHLLIRDWSSGACKWEPATVNPRGLGFTGILTSEMFGFRSDLDDETLADLDSRVRLMAKHEILTAAEKSALLQIDERLADAGFARAFSDPYYAAFVRAWGRRHTELMQGVRSLTPQKRQEIERVADEVLKEAAAEVENELGS